MKYHKLHYFKSAVAFFFLFFLHGISFGTRHQGISYNVSGLYEGGELNHKTMNGERNLIQPQMLIRCAEPPLLYSPCYVSGFLKIIFRWGAVASLI